MTAANDAGSVLTRSVTPGGAQWATLTLDSPPLNLVSQAMIESLEANLSDLTANPPRALLINARGKVVSGGVDVHVFDGLTAATGEALWERMIAVPQAVENLPCPVVFAAHGLCLTAAFEIALAADLIWASPKASFGLVETVVGLTPSMGGPQRLAERAGSGRARELVMTAGRYPAETLAAWGVVNTVTDNLEADVAALIEQLADGPTLAHHATKDLIAAWRNGGVAQADSITPARSGLLFDTQDTREAIATFLAQGPGNATYQGK